MPSKTPKIVVESEDAINGAEDEETPSLGQTPEEEVKPAPKPKTPKKGTSKGKAKAPPPPVYNTLRSSVGDAAPVDVLYESETTQATMAVGEPGFSQVVKFQGPRSFRVVTSIMMDDGPFKGHQAVLILPAKPFNFLGLPKVVRIMIYKQLFASHEDDKGKVVISAAKGGGLNANQYTQGDKNRLSLLIVNREVTDEARPILYGMPFKFDNTNVVLVFLSQCGDRVRPLLRSVEIVAYQKVNAQPAFSMLAECKNLQRLHISTGVALKSTPTKAATTFFTDTSRFLEVMGSTRGRKDAGMEIMHFGRSKNCFSIKEGKEAEPRAWDMEEREEFQSLLRGKLQSFAFKYWTCICGCLVPGHSCGAIMEKASAATAAAANNSSSTQIAAMASVSGETVDAADKADEAGSATAQAQAATDEKENASLTAMLTDQSTGSHTTTTSSSSTSNSSNHHISRVTAPSKAVVDSFRHLSHGGAAMFAGLEAATTGASSSSA